MKNIFKIIFVLFIVVFIISFNFLAGVSQDGSGPNSCLSSGCHSELKFTNMHQAAKDDCANCHKSVVNGHPENPGKDFILSESVPELCSTCHNVMNGKMSTHAPASVGKCLDCHNPHGSNTKGLMKSDNHNDVCSSCHDFSNHGSSLHYPVLNNECSKCHDAHSSDRLFLLNDEPNKQCLNCHSKSITKDSVTLDNIKHKIQHKFVHAPMNKDVCTSCHDPHTSQQDDLLIFEYHDETYVFERDKSISLCFSCHSEDLISNNTPEATGFRDEDKNLHFIHVNRDKSRNCTVCHDAHGSNTEFIINQSVQYGKWILPINFTKSENGGTCESGCHRKLSYKYSKEMPKQSVEAKPGLVEDEILGQVNCEIKLNPGYDHTAINKIKFYLVRLDSLSSRTIEIKNRLSFKIKDIPLGEYSLVIDKTDLVRLGAKTEKEEQKFRISGVSEISIVNLKYFLAFSSDKHMRISGKKNYKISMGQNYDFSYQGEINYKDNTDFDSFLNYAYRFMMRNPGAKMKINVLLKKGSSNSKNIKSFNTSIGKFFTDYGIPKKRLDFRESASGMENDYDRISIVFEN